MTVFIIEKQLHKVGVTALVGYVLACFGFIHSAQLGFYPTSLFAIGYLIIAVLAFLLHLGRNIRLRTDGKESCPEPEIVLS